MAKKSFKDNPALQFISTPEPEETTPAERMQEPIDPKKQPADRGPVRMPRLTEKPPAGYKINPLYVETKSRRLQLVLQPSLYDRVKAGAVAAGLSVNEYVHQILDDATRED